MSKLHLRAVFFDLVGTLVRPAAPIGWQYAGVAERHGVAADAGALDAAFHRAMASTPALVAPGASLEAIAAAEREWWRRLVSGVVDECGITGLQDPARFEPYFDDLYEHFTTSAAWTAYDDVVPGLAELHAAGLMTGLVTNYDTRVYRLLDSLGLTPWLDSVTIPASAGAAKPDARIFAHALSRHGLQAGEAAYVGDSPGDDYEGAGRAGLLPVLLDRDGRHAGLHGLRRASDLWGAVSQLRGEVS